jgi:RNA polymerase sigma factor, sigma-70 family
MVSDATPLHMAGTVDPADSFAQLYRDRSGAVYAMMLRLSGIAGVAEELTQETFMRAWRSYAGFRGDSAAGTWVHTIALRVWADWLRTRPPEHADLAVVDEAHVIQALANAIPDTQLDLEASIARLPPRMREALVLHYLHEYSVREVAEALGKAPGTIKAQLHAARELLRRTLK